MVLNTQATFTTQSKTKIMNIEDLHKYTSPVYWVYNTLKVIVFTAAHLLGIIYRPIRNFIGYHFIVKRYAQEECVKAYDNLNGYYKSDVSKMNKDHRRTYEYCKSRINSTL